MGTLRKRFFQGIERSLIALSAVFNDLYPRRTKIIKVFILRICRNAQPEESVEHSTVEPEFAAYVDINDSLSEPTRLFDCVSIGFQVLAQCVDQRLGLEQGTKMFRGNALLVGQIYRRGNQSRSRFGDQTERTSDVRDRAKCIQIRGKPLTVRGGSDDDAATRECSSDLLVGPPQ